MKQSSPGRPFPAILHMFSTQTISAWMDRRFYPDYEDSWDNALFRATILRYLNPRFKVLDLGAGAGIIPEMNLRGLAQHVVGIDPNPKVVQNPYLDSAYVGVAESLPFEADSFDLVVSANVFEHLTDPVAVLHEVRRVMKPGGILLVKTPNLWHYVPVLSRVTPFWFHQIYHRYRGGREEDVFPTVYRANTPGRLRALAKLCELPLISVQTVEGRPEYLRVFPPAYCWGLIYERAVNALKVLSAFRVVLIAVFEKPQPGNCRSLPDVAEHGPQ
jgi:SAM-dependent methyltransferase